MEAGATILNISLDIAFVLLMGAAFLAFLRLVRGPTSADRVVALDLITILAVAFSALYAISADQPAFLDVSIALALVAFFATIAFARFIERRDQDSPAREDRIKKNHD